MTHSTPATRAGLSVGDPVVLRRGSPGSDGYFEGQVFLKRDDGSSVPLFGDNHGNTLWLALSDVSKGVLETRTPSQIAGLKVGDEVTITHASVRGLRGRVFLHQDDGTRIPRFRDEFGNTHYVFLLDVTKAPAVPAGPRAGVAWTDAPRGATHYSLDSSYIEAWHKQNDDGTFAFKSGLGFTTYLGYAQEGVKVDKMVAIPGVTTKPNITGLVDELKAAQAIVAEKTAAIAAAGFHVVDGKLSKTFPQSEWKVGDVVRCIKRDSGLADITVGKTYVLTKRYDRDLAVIDDVGDRMGGCVERGCFEFVRRP